MYDEVVKELVEMAVPAVPVKPKHCKFCEDLDVLSQVVCYLPRLNGTEADVPINYCPNCGTKIRW